jgi:hypothetical protein
MKNILNGYVFLLHLFLCIPFSYPILSQHSSSLSTSPSPSPPTSFQIVVGRYDEAIDWLEPVMDHCIIYNKGEPLHVSNERIVSNLGRESESYIRYIVEHYYDLPEIVVFTQAHIADHKGSNNPNILLHLKDTAMKFCLSNPSGIHYINKQNRNQDWDPDWNKYPNGTWRKPSAYYNDTPITFKAFFLTHISSHYPNPLKILATGIFAVQKHRIIAHPLSYYKHLHSLLQHHNDPVEGEFMERCWYYIFTPQLPPVSYSSLQLAEDAPVAVIPAQAPWERCRDTIQTLPSPSSPMYTPFLYMSILTCGLFPYHEQDLQTLPDFLQSYAAKNVHNTGIGIGQYPDQLVLFLYHVQPFPIKTLVQLGITTPYHPNSQRSGDGGGFFIFVSEYLRQWNRLNDPKYNLLSVGMEERYLMQSLALYDLQDPYHLTVQDRLYQDNLLSYSTCTADSQRALIPGKTSYYLEDYLEYFRDTNPLIELFILDQYYPKVFYNKAAETDVNTLVLRVHEIAQVWYPFSQLLVFLHITDIRYPEMKIYWKAVKDAFVTRPHHLTEFTFQYDEIIRTGSPDQSISYYGIGVITNPIYFSCEEKGVCMNTHAWYRCLGILTTLSTVTAMPEVRILASIIAHGGLDPELLTYYTFPKHIHNFTSAFLGNKLEIQQSPHQVARLFYHMWEFAALYYKSAWRDFLYVYLCTDQESTECSRSDDGLFLLLHTWIQKWYPEAESYYQLIQIVANTSREESKSIGQETYRRTRIPAWEEFMTSWFVKDRSRLFILPPDTFSPIPKPIELPEIVTTVDAFLVNAIARLPGYAHRQHDHDLFLDAVLIQTSPSISYETMRSYVHKVMQSSRWIIFPFIQDIRYPAMKRLWTELQQQYPSQAIAYTDNDFDSSPEKNVDYLGIGVWINPLDLTCAWEDGVFNCEAHA